MSEYHRVPETTDGHGGAGREKQPNNGADTITTKEDVLSIPRGGPIYIPSLLSRLTSVPLFQSSLLLKLQDLEVELSSEATHVDEEDVSVDNLKIFTDEELVDMAMKEAFKEDRHVDKPSTLVDSLSNEEREDDHGVSNNKDLGLEISERETNGMEKAGRSEIMSKNGSRKRKRWRAHNDTDEEMYIAKVEEIAKIKRKQDEDKALVRLHSFNPSCRAIEFSVPTSEKIERMKLLRSATAVTKVNSSSIHEYIHVVHPEVALSIEVYHNVKKWLKTQEFLVLGRQTLTELRDKIYCLSDQVMKKAGQHDPSGYFLIEDFLCNDLRDPSAIDYSEPIFDWLTNNKEEAQKKWECIISGDLQQKQKETLGDTVSQLPQFKAVEMQKTRFCDLKFHLGTGYLYCHQGDCKHTIVIRDMRLVHPEDVQNQVAYPIVLFQLRPRVQKCCVCKIYRATKVTVDDKWAQGNPCYFCDQCYYLLHYKDGSLMYSDFSVYDYLHD